MRGGSKMAPIEYFMVLLQRKECIVHLPLGLGIEFYPALDFCCRSLTVLWEVEGWVKEGSD